MERQCEEVAPAILRIGHGRVRFANTGTEAAMLAVKTARFRTGRGVVLKAWAGYHGSYDDLEAGLAGRGPIATTSETILPGPIVSATTRIIPMRRTMPLARGGLPPPTTTPTD